MCRETGEKDVRFKVLFCGICHSDLHMLKNEWGNSVYPVVPGYVMFSGSILNLKSITTNYLLFFHRANDH